MCTVLMTGGWQTERGEEQRPPRWHFFFFFLHMWLHGTCHSRSESGRRRSGRRGKCEVVAASLSLVRWRVLGRRISVCAFVEFVCRLEWYKRVVRRRGSNDKKNTHFGGWKTPPVSPRGARRQPTSLDYNYFFFIFDKQITWQQSPR